MKKRLISMLLVFALLLAMVPLGASGASEDEFVIDENGVLTEYNGSGGDVTIPDGVTSIVTYVFSGCNSLTSVTIPDSVTSIGFWAFEGCSSLTSVTIGNGVTEIGNGAFENCASLTSVTIPTSMTEIGEDAFASTPWLTSLCEKGNGFGIVNGILIDYQGEEKNITIPESVTSIGEGAFRGCDSLISVAIPDSVTIIGEGAFAFCESLSSVTIPNSVTSIDYFTFCNCIGLTSVTIPNNVTSIGGRAFEDCHSLTTVTIPSSVIRISYYAFNGCYALKDVYYGGSETQWENIDIDIYNYDLMSSTIHYNSIGPNMGDAFNAVQYLSGWQADTRQAFFGNSALAYTVTDETDLSAVGSLEQLVGKYVLVETDEDQLFTITSIKPVESAIGQVAVTGEHSLSIGGVTYPVRENYILSPYDGKEVIYHTCDGTVAGLDILAKKTGTLEQWDSATSCVTIDGKVYPTNFLSDMSFLDDIDEYLNFQIRDSKIAYYIADSGTYTPIIKVEYLSGDLDDFNASIYHAKWLSKNSAVDDLLDTQTPSQSMVEAMDETGGGLAIDMWRSFELVFDTMDDVTALYDFAVAPKDVYSALILDALEASVSYDVVGREYEDGLKLCKDLVSSVSTAFKANYNIDLNNDAEFQDALQTLGVDFDEIAEKFTDEWFKEAHPNLKSLGKSFKWFSTGLKTVSNVEDLVEYCAACYTLSQLSDSMVEVLERGYDQTKKIYGPIGNITLAFKECLDMVTQSTEELIDQMGTKVIAVITKAGVKYIVGDLLWSEVTSYVSTACPAIAFFSNWV